LPTPNAWTVTTAQRLALALCGLALGGPVGCAAPGSDDDDGGGRGGGGKADELDGTAACPEIFDGRHGFSRDLVDPATLRDPIAQFVLRAQGDCPDTFTEAAAALAKRDTAACDPAGAVQTAVISETSQVLGKPDRFRAIANRSCGGHPEHGVLMSIANLRGNATETGDDAEFMAFDETLGMFAFYTLQGGQWTFHGNSHDLVAPDTGSRCAACHIDGGMIMKELDTPWLHWEGDSDTPGAAALIDRIDDLGARQTGADLEQTVLAANAEWTAIWVKDLLLENDLERVLAPLFCTKEFNLGTAGKAAGDGVRFVPAEALVDDTFDAGAFGLQINVSPEAYAAAIAETNQRVQVGGAALVGPDGKPVVDTHFKLAFVQRARSDQQFVDRLVQIGVIDREFALDVLAVDFTRPVFSEDRCALLEFVPSVPKLASGQPDNLVPVASRFEKLLGDCCTPHDGASCSGETVAACVCAQDDFCCTEQWDALCVAAVAERGCAACPGTEGAFKNPLVDVVPNLPERIRDGFVKTLTAAKPAAGTPAAELLANLQTQGGEQSHPQRVAEFFTACNARPEAERIADVLTVISGRRAEARSTPLIEHEASLPVDDLDVARGTTLDPTTCTLVEP
jgi:hypothetical protein